MSPFKKCILSSQDIIYKSVYLNPLSDSPEHPLSSSTSFFSSSSSSYSSLSSYLSPSSFSSSASTSSSSSSSSRVMKDQATPMALQNLKENDPPTFGHSEAKADKETRTRPPNCVKKREPLRTMMVSKRTLKSVVEGNPEEGIATANKPQEIEETAPLFPPPTPTHLSHMWDEPECAVAPAPAWSTLGNRTLLCRPLPVDVGRCVCYIARERQDGLNGYALYTDEGQGRQDRKLAIAHHRRRAGRSEFVVYPTGIDSIVKSEAVLGRVQANLLGSRYSIWDEVGPTTSRKSSSRPLLGVVMFEPTVTTLTGTFRVMRVYIPKYQSMQITPSNYREKNSLAPDWEENAHNVHQLCSRKPYYNKVSRRYELDFRDRAKRTSKIKTSAKNLQLTMDENGKQAILMLGKIGKSKYVMEYRFPFTAYQAFSICLASMDSKLCCSL